MLRGPSLPPAQPCPQHGAWVPGFGADVGGLLPAGLLPPRIHAEFQLSEPPDFPFWFSPGQFTGHIVLSKDATHVRDFRLFVPNHRWELGPQPLALGLDTGAQRPPQSLPLCSQSPLSRRDLELTRKRQLEEAHVITTSMSQVLHGPGPPALPRTQGSGSRPTLMLTITTPAHTTLGEASRWAGAQLVEV